MRRRRRSRGEREGGRRSLGEYPCFPNGGYMVLVECECVEMGEGGKCEAVIGKIIVVKNQLLKGLEVTNTF